ncbi:MAG TPA: diacylglycerol kinase family protein [Spirochaetota bacterium]|nr:diacylglycerol kinase family protein [Spirochaetota bacterium]
MNTGTATAAEPRLAATIIVNPASRSGSKIFEALKEHLRRYFDYAAHFTERRGHAVELARKASGGVIIVCGGDGTINEVANGVAHRSDIAVAPTYGGSGCDLSRLFGIAKAAGERVDEIYDRLLSGGGIRMLLSLVEANGTGRYFVGVGDAGFGAMVAGTFDRYRRLGKFGYVLGVLQTLMKIKPIEAVISIDGKPRKERALMVMFARSKYYAGGMKVSPNSDPLSDSARMIFLKWMSRPVFLTVFPRVYSGSHLKVRHVDESEVRRLEIETPGVPIDVEGEYVGTTPCVFSITDRYITIV